MLRLHSSATSPYVRKVRIVLLETGQNDAVEQTATAVAPTSPNSDLNANNPIGKVPALVTEDGLALYDSPVICEYLDSLHGGAKMFPSPGPSRWRALRRQALGDGLLDAAILGRYETSLRPAEILWPDWVAAPVLKISRGFFQGLRAKFREQLEERIPEIVKLDRQQVGYFALDAVQRTMLAEVVFTPVYSLDDGRKVGIFVLGFPFADLAEQTIQKLGQMHNGIWLGGKVHSKTIPTDAQTAVASWMQKQLDQSETDLAAAAERTVPGGHGQDGPAGDGHGPDDQVADGMAAPGALLPAAVLAAAGIGALQRPFADRRAGGGGDDPRVSTESTPHHLRAPFSSCG